MSENKNHKSSKFSYKDTLNLLKTEFSMRANSVKREPEIQKFWSENKIDMNLGLNNKGKNFTLHDGPPYANGPLHMGHALNKVLKDFINKYKILKGYRVNFFPLLVKPKFISILFSNQNFWISGSLLIELALIEKSVFKRLSESL